MYLTLFLFLFAEVHFTQIIELLHVPLQSLYTYKSLLEEKQKLKQQNQPLQQPQQQSHLANNIKTIENGHNNKDDAITN